MWLTAACCLSDRIVSQDSLKKEESMKKELQMRLAVAKFMQETLQEMAGKKADASNAEQGGKASGAIEVCSASFRLCAAALPLHADP